MTKKSARKRLSNNNYAFLLVQHYAPYIDQMHLAHVEWLRGIAPVVGYSDRVSCQR